MTKNLDPTSAVTFALNTTSWGTGLCLNFVDHCFGQPGSDLPPLPPGGVEDAIQGWEYSQHRHPGDGTDAPAGVPVYFTPTANPAGHIVTSIGEGLCRSTDWPSAGQVSTVSIAYLASVRGKPCLGWTDDYLGNLIDLSNTGNNSVETDDDMPISDDDINRIAAVVVPQVNGLFRLTPAPGEAALNISTLIPQVSIGLDQGPEDVGHVLNDIFQTGRRNQAAIKEIADKLGVTLAS